MRTLPDLLILWRGMPEWGRMWLQGPCCFSSWHGWGAYQEGVRLAPIVMATVLHHGFLGSSWEPAHAGTVGQFALLLEMVLGGVHNAKEVRR